MWMIDEMLRTTRHAVDGDLLHDLLAAEACGRRRLVILAVGKARARGFIERITEHHITCGGDGSMGTGSGSDAPRKIIRAKVSAQERDHAGAIFGNGDDRRFPRLVAKLRGDGADQDARGADTHHGAREAKGAGDGVGGLVVGLVDAIEPLGTKDDATHGGLDGGGNGQGGGAEHKDGQGTLCHLRP